MLWDNPRMVTAPKQAIILFAHGARAAHWSKTLMALQARVLTRCPEASVSIAFLEFQEPTLEVALAAAVSQGCIRIEIVPVFWASGGHVVNDLPPLLERMRSRHPQIEMSLLPVLSELPGLLDFVADVVASRCTP